MARHERAETVRKKRHDGTSPPFPSNRSVGAAIAFGEPVCGLTFNYVCNMRAITPGLLTSTRWRESGDTRRQATAHSAASADDMYRIEQSLTQENVGNCNSQNKAYCVRTKLGLFVLTRQIADPTCSININLNH